MVTAPTDRAPHPPTRLFGLAGDPLRRYPLRRLLETEAMINRLPLAVRHLSLRGLPTDPAIQAAQLIRATRLIGATGFYAAGVLPTQLPALVDQVSPAAQRSGLVDTVLSIDEETFGFDTGTRALCDAMGAFLRMAPRRQVLLVGSGPEAASAACALADLGVKKIYMLARDRNRAYSLSRFLLQGSPVQSQVLSSPQDLLDLRIDGVVNTLHSGPAIQPDPAQPDRTLVPRRVLTPRIWLIDTAITPFPTPLIRHAQHIGCRTLIGPDLVPYRGQHLFRCITGRDASPERLRALVRASLGHGPDWPSPD